MMLSTALKSVLFFIAFFTILSAVSGCGVKPLQLVPQFGAMYGADEIDCTYKRKGGKFVTDCTLHDEGEIN